LFLSLNQLHGPNMTWDPLLLDESYQVNDASSRTIKQRQLSTQE
jgi:hypothetical protein